MPSRTTLTLLFAWLTGMTGCAGTSVVRSTDTHGVASIPPAQIRGPYVPAGTEFTVLLDQPIDTQTSRVGDTFTARLETPLRTPEGITLIPVGSTVTGKIAALQGGRRPLIVLDFQSVQSSVGEIPIHVAVRQAERIVYRSEERIPQPPAARYTGSAVYEPTHGAPYQHSLGPTGGGYAVPTYVGPPRQARLETDARLRLVLTRPLLPPGSSMVPERP